MFKLVCSCSDFFLQKSKGKHAYIIRGILLFDMVFFLHVLERWPEDLQVPLLWEKMSRSLILRKKEKKKAFLLLYLLVTSGALCVCGFSTVLMPSGKWVTGRERFTGKKHLFLLNSSYWALRSMEVKTWPIPAQHTAQCVTSKLLLGIFVNCEMPGEADRVRNLMFSGESESENAGRLWEWDCTTVEEAEPHGVT